MIIFHFLIFISSANPHGHCNFFKDLDLPISGYENTYFHLIQNCQGVYSRSNEEKKRAIERAI